MLTSPMTHLLLDDTAAATTTLAETLPDLNESGSSLAIGRALLVMEGLAQATGDSETATELLASPRPCTTKPEPNCTTQTPHEQTIREDGMERTGRSGPESRH